MITPHNRMLYSENTQGGKKSPLMSWESSFGRGARLDQWRYQISLEGPESLPYLCQQRYVLETEIAGPAHFTHV